MDDSPREEARPDPGFRIFHLDGDGQAREVPPYTTPANFLASLRDRAGASGSSSATAAGAASSATATTAADAALARPEPVEERASDPEPSPASPSATYSERTYDGYQDIQQANARPTRQEELSAMREARRKNRQDPSTIDANQIGATRA
jgi:hypothetical protein